MADDVHPTCLQQHEPTPDTPRNFMLSYATSRKRSIHWSTMGYCPALTATSCGRAAAKWTSSTICTLRRNSWRNCTALSALPMTTTTNLPGRRAALCRTGSYRSMCQPSALFANGDCDRHCWSSKGLRTDGDQCSKRSRQMQNMLNIWPSLLVARLGIKPGSGGK
jgi:hypothetical protein